MDAMVPAVTKVTKKYSKCKDPDGYTGELAPLHCMHDPIFGEALLTVERV